jgi:hypothetical protein
MKTKSPTERGRDLLSSVKREMKMPRLAASVRNALEAEAALAARVPVAHSARA